jgi:hypothetical protein
LVAAFRANHNSPIRDSIVQLLPDIARFVEGGAHWTSSQRQMKYNHDDDDEHEHDHDHDHHDHDHDDIELSSKHVPPLPLGPEALAALTANLVNRHDDPLATIPVQPSTSIQFTSSNTSGTGPTMAATSSSSPSSILPPSPPRSPKKSMSMSCNSGQMEMRTRNGSVTMIIDDAVEYATRWTNDIKRLITMPWFDKLVQSADTRTAPLLPARPSSVAVARITKRSAARRWCSPRRMILSYIHWLSQRFEHDNIGDWT